MYYSELLPGLAILLRKQNLVKLPVVLIAGLQDFDLSYLQRFENWEGAGNKKSLITGS